jgi:uncharacterized membrane protein YcaP (DUF421 family)
LKGKIRIILLVLGAIAGGHLVDKNLKTKYPIFVIVLPIAASGMLWYINSEMNNSEPE